MSASKKSSTRFATIALILSLVSLLVTLIHISLFLVFSQSQPSQAPRNESLPPPTPATPCPDTTETPTDPAEIFLQALKHIANREAEEAAKYIVYPVVRPYPLPAIEDEAAFARAFSVLFDDDTLNQIAKHLAEGQRPERVGWRGYCYLSGSLWADETTGKIYVIQGTSSIERTAVSKAKEKEIATLHPELRASIANPIFSFLSHDQSYYGRIDQLNESTTDEEGEKTLYRISVFKQEQALDSLPAHQFLCIQSVEGTACNVAYYLPNGDLCFTETNAGPRGFIPYLLYLPSEIGPIAIPVIPDPWPYHP